MNNLNNNTLNLQTVLTQINNLPTSKGEFLKYINRETSSIDDDKITKVKDCAFAFCSNLSSVNLPNCETIGIYAFQSCPITSVSFPACTSIERYAFYTCSSLTSVNFPACETIDVGAFYSCSFLTTASFPVCTSIGSSAFYSCTSLALVSFPVCTNIGRNAFECCFSLTTASFPACTSISYSVFSNCYNLISLYLTGSSLCTLLDSGAFDSTPIGGYSASARRYGSIYVPASLLASYKAASEWSYFSSRFIGV